MTFVTFNMHFIDWIKVLLLLSLVDPGEGAPLSFRPNWGPRGRKSFFLVTAPPPPPYLRVLMTTPPLLSQRQDPALIIIIIVYLLLGYNTNE